MKFKLLNETFENLAKEKYDFDSLFSMKELRIKYTEFTKTIMGRRAIFGIPSIDYALYGGVKPSYVVGIVGETDIGKTTLAQHLSYHNSKALKDLIILLSSQETPTFDIYERTLQTQYNISSIEAEQAFQQDKQLTKDAVALDSMYDNLYTVVKRTSARDLYYYCLAIKKLTGKDVGCLIVDWLGMMSHLEARGEYDRITENMMDLEEIALHLGVPTFIFLQISKQEGKSGSDIGLHSAKGPGIIEHLSKIFITINFFSKANIEVFKDFPDIQKLWDKDIINVLKFTVKKKKYGRSKPQVLVLQNKKSLELCEFNPEYNYHTQFINKIKDSKIGKELFDAPF